jgi:hypothetical protein
MLPKLAQCGHYRPELDAGPAAARGTKLDEVFRALVQPHDGRVPELDHDEREALRWAVETAHALAGGFALESHEEALRIECLGLAGTADLLCTEARWSADLKSGQKRGYTEQQAAYALGFMERFFVEEWTVYLLFCDQREVETLRFTRDGAERIVRGALARARDTAEPPAVNEYCGWCAQRWQCPARRESLGIVPLDGAGALRLEDLPSPLLREFTLRAKVIEDFAGQARELLKTRCLAGEKIPGVALTSKRGARKVPARVIELHWKALGTADILTAYGAISEAKLREIWQRKMPEVAFPESDVEEMPGSTFVRVSRLKETGRTEPEGGDQESGVSG